MNLIELKIWLKGTYSIDDSPISGKGIINEQDRVIYLYNEKGEKTTIPFESIDAVKEMH